ncbi:alpha-tectorin-like, partial [Garra rufa]|uniref:alpha-tectorin-like n=1 Tax=Garra rufa TaxID=137080 RepID=UPI003CCED2C1
MGGGRARCGDRKPKILGDTTDLEGQGVTQGSCDQGGVGDPEVRGGAGATEGQGCARPFYAFGNEDIRSPSTDDGSSPAILFEKPFVYFGQVYQKTYVNNNGHLTFDGPLSQPTPGYFQSRLNRDIIAPLWTDMDNRVNGTISYHLFYPFGNVDIKNPREDDGSSQVILLEKPFVYFGRVYRKAYVNNNGHLTFDGPLSQSKPSNLQSQLNRDIIAPLWTDMDNTVSGTISYRQVISGRLLLAASNSINQYFPNLNFSASWLFIATWDKVPYYIDLQSSSSFQVVLVSGGSLSFVMMNYGNISSTDHRFQAGYGTINSTNYFSIPVPDENTLFSSSNVNLPGRWAFRVDGGPKE